jgi:hypothetical protein
VARLCFRLHSVFSVCLFVLIVSTSTRCIVCLCVLHLHDVFSALVFCSHTVCSVVVCSVATHCVQCCSAVPAHCVQ